MGKIEADDATYDIIMTTYFILMPDYSGYTLTVMEPVDSSCRYTDDLQKVADSLEVNGESAADTKQEEAAQDESTDEAGTEDTSQQPSDSKHTAIVKNYVGRNAATIGYYSLGGDRLDTYGNGTVGIIFFDSDGTYISPDDDDGDLKNYVVTGQDVDPGTKIHYSFETDENGEEYDSLIAWQSVEQIVLSVRDLRDKKDDGDIALTPIKPSPDKYTWFVRNYVGRNLASCGYISLGGDFRDAYGGGSIVLVINSTDGSYVDLSGDDSDEILKKLSGYKVVSQDIPANTEIDYTFMTDDDGKEYSNLTDSQTIDEINLTVEPIQ